jgi:ankyrin repeat protein
MIRPSLGKTATEQGRGLDMQIPTIQSSIDFSRIGALLILLTLAPTTHATVYKCTAKDGSTAYSDQPCDTNARAIQVTPEPLHSTPNPTTQSTAPGNGRLNQAQEQMVSLCARANYDAWYQTQNPKPTPDQTNAKLRESLQTCRAIVPRNSAIPLSQGPAIIAAAQDKSAREIKASLCSTKTFNDWIKAQGHPLPEPSVRIAKMIEISDQCRRPLGLPDVIPPAPIAAPKPNLQGSEGAAAAANLKELIRSGSIERLQKYLSTPGVDINDRPGTDEALLDYAAEQNQAKVARFLLEHGARVDATQNRGPTAGYTALHRAAIADAAEVAQLLLASGAEVNFHGPLGITPLILASSNGSRRTAEVLLDHGADVSTPDGHRETALTQATAHDHGDIVRLLLIHLPAPSSANMNAVAMRGDLEALRLIVRHDELVHDVRTSMKDEALRFTILGGPIPLDDRKQMIELLLADGADIDNHQPGLDVIPVMLAPTPEMAGFLFAHGANKKAKLSGAQLARWYVCNNSGKDPLGTLQVVVAHGIDIGGATSNGDSALPCATYANNSALVAFLQAHNVSAGRSSSNPPNAVVPPAAAAAQGTQLFPKRACVQLDSIDNSHTPIELYSSLNDCMQNNRDADAVSLFILAGMDSSFDSVRVADKTAGQARAILIMALFEGMAADVHARFETATKSLMDHPSRHAILCEQVKKVGPPQYFPAYMVNHGLGVMQSALANQASPTPLEPKFDAAATWRDLITNYLNCGGAAAPQP